MKIIVKLTLLFLSITCSAQKELQIVYYVKNNEVISGAMEYNASLKANNQFSLFTETVSYMVPSKQGKYRVDQVVNQSFKDLSTNTVWTLEDQKSTVKEHMNLFNWNFTQNVDTILNYLSRKATAHFRGRYYEAWFTTEIPFRAAPWKIHGLPGVVLKLEIDTDFYLLEATDLAIVDSIDEIESPFKEKEIVTWEEYVIQYKEWRKVMADYTKSESIRTGKDYDFSHPKIEIVVEDNKRETFDEMGKRIGYH